MSRKAAIEAISLIPTSFLSLRDLCVLKLGGLKPHQRTQPSFRGVPSATRRWLIKKSY